MIELMKEELGRMIMTKSALRPKTYSYLIGNCNTTIKKAKGTMKCVVEKSTIKPLNNEVILKSQQMFKIEVLMYVVKKLTILR